MAATELDLLRDEQRSNWVRLRTLLILRWIAVLGQTTAIVVADCGYRLDFEVGLAAMTVGVSVLTNLFMTFLHPRNKRLSEREAAFMLGFDILQLGLLLFITGGLNNPFALLILAPVTIAATVLHPGSTMVLGALAVAIVTLIGPYHLPMHAPGGAPLVLPDFFGFGFWLALAIGIVFLGGYTRQVTAEMHDMNDALVATQLALAREQKLTDLGGVVAAAAHELGSPLATIKLVSSELMEELSDRPDLLDDARLVRDQADRCSRILHSMGRAGKEDEHLKRAPLEALLREAAEPHADRGKAIRFEMLAEAGADSAQPVVLRRPEIVHGLRNLVQNAVDFARSEVVVSARWSADRIAIRIADDGAGFPTQVISRIGDPFVRRRRVGDSRPRPGYDGMGLGLFIAKTLLERTGARLTFANGGGRARAGGPGGAIVEVVWPRHRIDAGAAAASALGENRRIEPWPERTI